ncbi:MAG: sigma 54-interacting transcriptional regulator, partial [Pseudomonadota bacterium]
SLFEAAFFGHEAGAYTGAQRARTGHFEAANGGTIFLDEIASLPLHLQASLLRVLQEREVTRIGARRAVPLDLRILAATNEAVADAVAEGRLRQDLLYRLNTLAIAAPPLRARDGDVTLLFEHFLGEFAARHGVEAPILGPRDQAALAVHSWPGNVRELMNLAERTVLRARRGAVDIAALLGGGGAAAAPGEEEDGPPEGGLRARVERYERSEIARALARHGGVIAPVLEELAIPRRTLNEKMQRYGLSRSEFRLEED